jgi:hypothetical protein
MSQVTFADLIRVPLEPSEAVALTLAVAEELESERAAGHGRGLPRDESIVLQPNGQVSFSGPRVPDDECIALARLLNRLLGITTGRRGRASTASLQQPHGGATSIAQFRSDLQRIAPIDASVLAGVFWRAAGTVRDRRRRAAVGEAPCRFAGRERRRPQPSATELRRAMRDVEHELFNALAALTAMRSAAAAATIEQRRWRRVVPLMGIPIVALSVLVGIGARTIVTRVLSDARPETSRVDRDLAVAPATLTATASPAAAPAPASPSVRVVHPKAVAAVAAARHDSRPQVDAGHRTVTPRRATPRAARATAPAAPFVFAGGTRTISWMNAAQR